MRTAVVTARSQHSAPFCGRFLDAELGQKQKQHMIPERSRFSTVEMEGGSLFSLLTSKREKQIAHEARGGERKCRRRGFAKKKNLSQTSVLCVCVGGFFGGGPLEIIFILKVEVSELSDHNKHGQPGFRLWLR